MGQLKREYLSGLIRGYKKSNEVVLLEKKQRLTQMTVDDSLNEYDYLCDLYAASEKRGLERLGQRRIEFLVRRRRALNKEGTKNANEPAI
jgi:hypothetical protein